VGVMSEFVGKYFKVNFDYGKTVLFKVVRETKTLFVLENGLKFKKKAHCGGDCHYGYGHNNFGKFMTKDEFLEIQQNQNKAKIRSKMIGEIYDHIMRGSSLYNKTFDEIEALYNLLKQMEIIP